MNRRVYQDPRVVALIAAMGLGAVMFDNTAVITAIPSIQADLNTETSALQWILSAMSIATGTILPFAGAFAISGARLRHFASEWRFLGPARYSHLLRQHFLCW